MADLVRVIYRKYDGTLHWNSTMRRLGEDEHGVWLGQQAGGTTRKGAGPPVTFECAHVTLFPRDAWWTAAFNAPPRRTALYVDITTPPRWRSAAEVTMVDLDLDVARQRGEETPRLLDEDEFADHRVRYGYSEETVARATASAEWLMAAVAAGTEPFGGAHRRWLEQVADGDPGPHPPTGR